MDRNWYDREGSMREFLSPNVSAMYIPGYFQQMGSEAVGAKVGVAALSSLFVAASGSYGVLFWTVVVCWGTDMLFGTLRVLKELLKPPKQRSESFRWSKAGDGILRLIVIAVLPGLLAMVGSVANEVIKSLGFDTQLEPLLTIGLATFALSWILVHEFISVLNNASKLHPGVKQLVTKITGWIPEKFLKEVDGAGEPGEV